MTEDETSPISTFEATHTGLYEVKSDGVTQYVWVVKGEVVVKLVRSNEDE